jgi:glycosyltransferase involved in cell wall biosynthesis
MPVWNGAAYLGAAIESLLAQTFEDFELIISDNGSTDGTASIAESYAARDSRVRVHRSDVNRGAAWNWNRVFQLSSAELFKWASHDDLHEPEYLARCIEVLDREPGVGLCYSASRSIDGQGATLDEWYADDCHLTMATPARRFAQFLGKFPAIILFGVARRAALDRTRLMGSFACADRVLMGEIALQGQLYELQDPLFVRRVHGANSWNPRMTMQEYAAWYDPRNAGKFTIHFVRRGIEYTRAVHFAQLPPSQAAACYAALATYSLQPLRRRLRRRYLKRWLRGAQLDTSIESPAQPRSLPR